MLHSEIVINELLAGSETCCGADIFDGSSEDFVELYNNGTEPISINGWGFSDTEGVITTTAPDTSIAPSDFLVLWYTGDNNGFPERMNMELVEPLRELFKDEVRELGKELGIPSHFIERHPFPGPGLAIRLPGAISSEKADILRKADTIYIEEIRKAGLYNEIWQAFAVLLPVQTVGVMGDERTYDFVCALRAVTSLDGMTADYYPFEQEFLANVSTRIINEVKGINRVVYDITSKPPGTIEWE